MQRYLLLPCHAWSFGSESISLQPGPHCGRVGLGGVGEQLIVKICRTTKTDEEEHGRVQDCIADTRFPLGLLGPSASYPGPLGSSWQKGEAVRPINPGQRGCVSRVEPSKASLKPTYGLYHERRFRPPLPVPSSYLGLARPNPV